MYPYQHQGGYQPGMYAAPPQQFQHQVDMNIRKDQGESKMEGINSDKVNIHLGGGGSGGGDAGAMAALVAALGNRNNGSDNAALVAALGNRNNDGFGGGGLGALLALGNNGGFGGGANGMWPLLLLALLGRGGLGFVDRDGHCHDGDGGGRAALLASIASGVNGLTASVPATALETQGVVQSAIAQLALAGQQGFSNVKDSVQAASAVELAAITSTKDSVQNLGTALASAICGVNQNISAQGCQTRETVTANTREVLTAIAALGTKMDQNTILDLQRQLGVAEARGAEDRNHHRARETEVNITQSVNQIQAQAQAQLQTQNQFDRMFGLINGLATQIQLSKATQDIVNLGTMTASGTQASTNTQVR